MMPENKDSLCRSMLHAQIQDPIISKRFIPCLGSFSSSRPIYVKEGINAQLSLPADNFMPSRTRLAYDFMKGMRLNIAVEHDDHSF
jgi:UPF0176 protein